MIENKNIIKATGTRVQLSSIFKVGGIYQLERRFDEETEFLTAGTPVKVLSIDEEKETIECEDYRGKSHFIESCFLDVEEIKKYPNPFKVLQWKIKNYLSGDTFYLLSKSGAIIFLYIAFSCFVISNIFSLDDVTITHITLSALIISGLLIILCMFDIYFFKNPLFIKENLKELKILFNKKGAKTGSEAFTKDKGEAQC